jgi:deoxyadenosine/deoxycytidine kinase
VSYIEKYLKSKKDSEKSLRRIEKRNEKVETANRRLNKYISILTKTLYANIILMVSILCFISF